MLLDRTDLSAEDLDIIVNGLIAQLNNQQLHYSGGHLFEKIARHPNTSTTTLSTLLNLPDGLGAAALTNPNISPEVIQSYVDKIRRGNVTNLAIVRRVLEVTDDTDFLRRYAKSGYWNLKRAVASNIHTPIDVLESLASDSDSAVKNAAKNTLAKLRRKSAKPRKASTTGWEVSPYSIETYAEIADELDPLIADVMTKVGKARMCTVDYRFDTNDYDTVDTLTLTISSGSAPAMNVTLDAQQFLAYLTSDSSKNVCTKNAVEYVQNRIDQLQAQ